MFDDLIRRWWIVGGRGLVAVAFGVGLFVARAETLGVLVSLFGVFALADGLFTLGVGLAVGWLPFFLEGVVGLMVGLFAFVYPPITEFWFVQLIIAWALVTGVLEIVGALRLRPFAHGSIGIGAWLLGLSGLASIVFGVLVAVRPDIWLFTGLLGGYALASGVLLLILAANVRTWQHVSGPATA